MSDVPTVLDLSAARCTEGFFLRSPEGEQPYGEQRFQPAATDGMGWRFCDTFRDSPTSLRDAVLNLIRTAQRKVFVTSFILGDEELIEALVSTARRLTGGVYVISELSEQSLRRGLAELADRSEQGRAVTQKVEAEKKRFMSLVNQGVAVRGHENCHAKFVVVDDRVAWVGSANLETRAFTLVGEVGVVFDDPQPVGMLARLFARMWMVGCSYELPSFVDGYRVTERHPAGTSPVTVPDPPAVGTRAVVWTDEPPVASLRDNLIDVIARARRKLVLASFSLNRLDEHRDLVLDPVAEAVARGVEVSLFVRAMNNRDRHRRQAGLFHDLGVRIAADDFNHAKAAVADGVHGMLFSANLDAEHGLIPGTGIEVGVRLDGTPALPELDRYLDHAMRCATRRFVPTPTTQQLQDGLATPWQSPWSGNDEIEVRCPGLLWRELVTQARHGPALWSGKADGAVEISVGGLRLVLRTGAGATLEHVRDEGADRSSEEELAQWMRAPADKGNRGFCTARFRAAPA